jgi:hypothetical protein
VKITLIGAAGGEVTGSGYGSDEERAGTSGLECSRVEGNRNP